MGTIITRSDKEVLHFFDEMKRVSDLIDHLQADNRHLLDGENYLTDTELAGKLKLSKRTLLDYRSSGILPYYHIALLPDRRKNPIPGKRYRTTAGKEPERSVLTSGSMKRAIPPHPLEYSLSLFIRVLLMSASYFSGISLQSLHIMAQHIVGRIAEHFPNVFFGNPVSQGDCRSECIAGHLGGQTLGNPT